MESTQNLILEKYPTGGLPGDNLTHKLENVRKLVKEEIRKELKIKEGEQNWQARAKRILLTAFFRAKAPRTCDVRPRTKRVCRM